VARYSRESWGIQYHIFALPFAAIGVGAGLERFASVALLRWDRLVGAIGLLSAIVLSMYIYCRLIGGHDYDEGNRLAACGVTVSSVTSPGEKIAVVSSSPRLMNGILNNYQDPTLFFYARRYGWSLPSDGDIPTVLESARQAGASLFVFPSPNILRGDSLLALYLEEHADPVLLPENAGLLLYRPHR
jgi:hypothetical protein